MTDIAHLRYDIDSSPAQAAANDLDKMSAAAKKAEQATLAMQGGSQRASSAARQMAESVLLVNQELIDAARYERAAALAMDQAAASTLSLSAAAGQVAPALSKAGTAAASAASHFDHLHDSFQRDFAAQYAAQMGSVIHANDRVNANSKVLAQTTLNLSRQFADVGVQAAMGTDAIMIAIMQGPQIADAFAQAKSQGLGFKDALKGIAAGAVSLAATWGPLILVGGALFGAFTLWRKHVDDLKAAQERLAAVSKSVADGQQAVLSAFSSASAFAEKYEASSTHLNKAIDKYLTSQNAAYGATLAGIGATDQATQAAQRRAEMERLLTVNLLRKAAAEAEIRAKENEEAAKKSQKTADRAGLWSGIGQAWMSAEYPGAVDPLAVDQQVRMQRARELGVDVAKRSAAAELENAKALRGLADETLRMTLITPEAQKARADAAKAADRDAKRATEEAKRAREATEGYITGLQRELAAVGQTSNAIRRLAADREIELALKRGDVDSAVRIKGLILEIEKTEDLAEALEYMAKARKAAIDAANSAGPLKTIPTDVVFDKPDRLGELTKEFEEARRKADEVRYAVEDIFYSIRDNDWLGAFSGLLRVLEQVKKAFADGATTADKFAAAASVVGAVGGLIGGTAGKTLSGAASGAQAGFMLSGSNPIGAVVGAALGGLAGFLGGKSEEKQRRQAEELARQQAEHQRALDLTNAKREQEITLLELTGKASEALKLRREAELAAMDASLQATQLKIWALQDEQAAAEARAALDIRLMDAQGRASESLALKRAREIAAANDNERGILREIFAAEDVASARDALSEAYERESSALQATIDKFKAFSDGLKKFRDSLYSGPAAMLSPEEQYKAARAAFDKTSALATGGDEAAIRDLESVSQGFLDASKSYYASSTAYFADLERVRAAVTATQAYAAAQVSTAEAQLSALNASVAGILGVQNAVLSVRDALAGYQAAILAQKAVVNDNALTPPTANDNTPALPQAADWASYLKHYPDVLAEYRRLSPNNLKNNLKVNNELEFAQWHYQTYGKGEGRTPFATGGSFTVGGSGGTDSQAFGPIALSPGEVVNVRRPGDVAADNAALRDGLQNLAAAFKEVVAEVRAGNIQRGAAATETIKKLDQLLDVADDQERATRQTVRAA